VVRDAGASAGALRLPVLAAGFSTALVGGSGSRSGSSSGSLPAGWVSSHPRKAQVASAYLATRTGSAHKISTPFAQLKLMPQMRLHAILELEVGQ
jgi:hypothetical protein